jgi:glycosyltransferase involved in cell wall biosynthesis
MIFLNAEKFIREAIESVIAQTYENWELLLVGGDSTDKSNEIVMKFADHFSSKLRYLYDGGSRSGIAHARNVGIANANGKYIAFLDADDVWLPNKLERQVAIAEQDSDIGLVFNPIIYWHVEDKGRKHEQIVSLSHGRSEPPSWFRSMMENDNDWPFLSSILIKKDLLVKVEGFEESFRDISEDWSIFIKISLNAPVFCDPTYLALYRGHSIPSGRPRAGSIRPEERILDLVHLNSWAIDYLEKHNNGQYKEELPRLTIFRYRTTLRWLVRAMQFELAAAVTKLLESQNPELLKLADWNYHSACCLHSLGINLREALQRFDFALELGFDELDVRYRRAYLYRDLGNMEAARADLKRALELRPNDPATLRMLYRLPVKGIEEKITKIREMIDRSQYQGLAEQLSDLVTVLPKDPELNYLLAFCLHIQNKDLELAIKHYDLALQYGFDEFWVRYNRGSLYAHLGNTEQAKADLIRAAELKPEHQGPQQILQQLPVPNKT